MKAGVLILLSIILGALGQLSLKQGMMEEGEILIRPEKILPTLLLVFSRPFVLLGLFFYAVSTIFWLMVLSRVELSYAYPMLSLGYVLVVFFSWVLWREQISSLRIFSLLLICVGVILLSRS